MTAPESDKTSIEKDHYDLKATRAAVSPASKISDLKDKLFTRSDEFFRSSVADIQKIKGEGLILDFGCGTGTKTIDFVNKDWRLIGIDISSGSIELAKQYASTKGIKAEYAVMDCEKMTFDNDIFDIVIDYGTFSSLNIRKAVPEILRILKPGGVLISVETLSHNPFFNLNRIWNFLTGKRTKWAVNHISSMDDWKFIKSNFQQSKMDFFGLVSPFLLPAMLLMSQRFHSGFLELGYRVDSVFLKVGFLKKYSFRTVCVLFNPKK